MTTTPQLNKLLIFVMIHFILSESDVDIILTARQTVFNYDNKLWT